MVGEEDVVSGVGRSSVEQMLARCIVICWAVSCCILSSSLTKIEAP